MLKIKFLAGFLLGIAFTVFVGLICNLVPKADAQSNAYIYPQCVAGQYVVVAQNQSGSSVAITSLDKKC